ncbi:Uma2 family endonuclease [Nonomuraea typhae]|uniref:Uma2 family endonuclease n=1 Tax=Nonomuraea typhae TaxID=2603600 RepID=A0ABW7YMG2_9ACTN
MVLPEFPDDEYTYELFNGSLLRCPLLSPLHQRAVRHLCSLLHDSAPVSLQPLPRVGVKAGDDDFFVPDVVVAQSAAVHSGEPALEPGHLTPIAEVVSPDTKALDRHGKLGAYAGAGIPLYWRIELDAGPTLYAYTLDADSYAGPEVHKAGAIAELAVPYEVSFDPGDLVKRRIA